MGHNQLALVHIAGQEMAITIENLSKWILLLWGWKWIGRTLWHVDRRHEATSRDKCFQQNFCNNYYCIQICKCLSSDGKRLKLPCREILFRERIARGEIANNKNANGVCYSITSEMTCEPKCHTRSTSNIRALHIIAWQAVLWINFISIVRRRHSKGLVL